MAEPLPDDHDCEKCHCMVWDDDEPHWHASESGLCLACGGCGDWACCQHDEDCEFEPRKAAT